jgi:hypothetical protein
MLFPNCYLHVSILLAILICIGTLCGILGIAAYLIGRNTRGIPKFMCAVVVCSGSLQIFHILALGLEGKPGIATIIFLALLDTIGGCLAPFVFLYAFCLPVISIMLHPEKKLLIERRMKLCVVIFSLIQIVVFTSALVYQYRGDYKTYNIIFSSIIAYVAFYAVLWVVAIWYFSSLLFRKMDELLARYEGQQSGEEMRIHRKKLAL